MSAHRCPGCGIHVQKTIEGNSLRWLESTPHDSGVWIVLPAEQGKTPQSRWAGMLDTDAERFHLHACLPADAEAYAASQRRAPTRRSKRNARQRSAAKTVDRSG
jgi:hypothetical protein